MAALSSSSSLVPSPETIDYYGLFFKSKAPEITTEIAETLVNFPFDLAHIITAYIIRNDSFGAEEWKKYFGVDVIDSEPPLPKDFYHFWFGPDPLKPTESICNNYLPLVLRPRSIKNIKTQEKANYNLNLLSVLFENPVEGNRLKLYKKPILEQVAATDCESPICWIAMRRDVVWQNTLYSNIKKEIKQLNTKTKIKYSINYSVLNVSTVLATQYVVRGEFYPKNPVNDQLSFAYTQPNLLLRVMRKICRENEEITIGFCNVIESNKPLTNTLLLSTCKQQPNHADLKITGFAILHLIK